MHVIAGRTAVRRFVLPLALAGTAACASTGSSRGPDISMPSDRVIATDDQGARRTTVAPNAKTPIPSPPDRTFEAARAVYEELGIPLSTIDPVGRQLGNPEFWKTHRLGKAAISTYLSCGNSITGVIADDYRVYMSVVSVVRSNGHGGSELETAFTAYALNMEGTAAERVACGTTGRLEDRIQKSVLEKVTKAGT